MPDSPENDLPDFDNPPVVETVFSAQFEKLPTMRSVHFGLFWQRIRDRFPSTEEHPPLDPVIEQQTERVGHAVGLRFEAVDTLSPQRVWFVNDTGDQLIQLQTDRFIKNWRKRDADYPRYKHSIKPAFDRDFQELQLFLTEEKLGQLKINQCEVTYVNHIVAGEGWSSWTEVEKVFSFWKNPPAESYPGLPEDMALRARFPIFDPNRNWIGRLHVEVQPALRTTDMKPMYVMNLTARGMYGKGLEFLDIGHRWVVKSFAQLTTEHMHNLWRKK
jgi:uncharacterized protein (TIGR04255 family)